MAGSSSRGRGRGRGRASMSFDYSQLGFQAGETLPAPVLQPPPIFPPLERKPVPLKSGPESEYMIALRRDYVESLRYLLSFKQTSDVSSGIERFSDKYHNVNAVGKDAWHSLFQWDRLPSELMPKSKSNAEKRKQEKSLQMKTSKKANLDVSSKLEKLAKLEEKSEEEGDEVKEDKDENEDNDEENLEEEDDDDEMDDGTDYANSYFDNGEGYYEDEDDNLDDGPVY